MARQSQFLSILLAVQIALAAMLYFTQTESGAFVSKENLLDLKFDSVDKIVIEEPQKKTLVLKKQGQDWILPDYYDFPASREKLDRVFGKLFETKVGWPVATTESAEKRFKVHPDAFERRLAFSAADQTKMLYLGTSPGFKKIHARLDGDTTVYGIEFSAYQASTKPIDWANQSVLHVPPEEITAIEIPGLVIKRDQEKLVIEGLAEGEQAVESELQNLLAKVTDVGFQEVLGKKENPSYQLATPALELTLVKKDGHRTGYRYGKRKDKDEYVLKTTDSEYYFNVPKYGVESLLGLDRKKLVKSAAAAAPAASVPPVPESKTPESRKGKPEPVAKPKRK